MSGFLPPVIFEVKAKATEAIAEFKKVNNELTKMEKKALEAGASINKMDKILKLTKVAVLALAASFGILGAVGVREAMKEEVALLKLQTAVNNVGQSFAAASPFIKQTAEDLIELGFADDDTYASLAKLTAATGSVKTAMKSMSVAADLARFKQISLTEASDLLARASTGQARGLRDLGIAMGVSLKQGASYEEILAAIEDRIGGMAEAFGDTASGKMAIFNAKFSELKEQIGYALLPLLIKVVDFVNKKLIPALSRFFSFIDRNRQIIINFGAAFAAIWAFAKIQAGVTAAITLISGLVKAYNALKVAGIAAAVAQRMAINPLLGAAASALVLGAIVKTISDAKKTNEEVKDLKTNLNDIGDGVKYPTSGLDKLADAFAAAKQKIADFNIEIKTTFTELTTSWGSITGRDFNADIKEGLLNPVDKLVTKSQTAINAYQNASNQYQGALTALKSAQDKYTAAVKSGNKTLIGSTESALKRAEELVTKLQSSMGDALKDIATLQQEMIDAVIDSEKKLAELRADRQKVLSDAFKEELQLQKDYNAKVVQLQKDAANRSAEIVKQSVDQLRNVFKGSTYRGIGDIFSGLTFEGKYLAGGSIQAITSALAKQTEKATSLADKAGKLQALGFTQTFIEEVVAQGPDVGGALADTILAGTPESIRQLQSYWLALEKVSSHGVDAVANKLNSGLTLATEELTAQLANVQTELTTALADAYQEYSDSLTAIREKTSEQIAAIDSQIAELIKKIAELKAALATIATLSAPGIPAVPVSPYNTTGPFNPQGGVGTQPYGPSSGATQNITINQTNNTNANADDIAKSTAWVIRTSSDVSFTGPAKYNVASKEYVAPKSVVSWGNIYGSPTQNTRAR